MLLKIAEIFGRHVDDGTAEAKNSRKRKICPFRHAQCNKGNIDDPLGICSFGNENQATVVCPSRFLEGEQIFRDAGRLAFGSKRSVAAIPEIRVLKVEVFGGKSRRIGKIDFMLAVLDMNGKPIDFAALEVQAVYISGRSIRPAFDQYLKNGSLPTGSERRPDFRSSAQKRLMPQLSLKVPIFRRWGKKFFVVVDQTFFNELPKMPTVAGIENSEVTWLVYPFDKRDSVVKIGEPKVVYTLWDAVMNALREGAAPIPSEILSELEGNLSRGTIVRT